MKSVLPDRKFPVTKLLIFLFVIVWVGILVTVGWVTKSAWRGHLASKADPGRPAALDGR